MSNTDAWMGGVINRELLGLLRGLEQTGPPQLRQTDRWGSAR